MPPSGTRALQIPRAKDCSLTQPSSGGREGTGPRAGTGCTPPGLRYQGVLGALGFAFFYFLNWREGTTRFLWRILILSDPNSGCPQRTHLQSTAPPNVTLLAGVTSGSSSSPSSLPLQPPDLGGNVPQGFPRRPQWTCWREAAAGKRRPGPGTGAGEARARRGARPRWACRSGTPSAA